MRAAELVTHTAAPKVLVAFVSAALVGCSPAGNVVTSTTSAVAEVDMPSSTSTVLDNGTTVSSTSTTMAPITGYGDFSTQTYFEIDWLFVTELVIRCMNDHGIPATLTPDGAGISAANIPPGQNQIGFETMNACREGLSLPPHEEANPDQLAEVYQYNLALMECLEAEGFDVSEPPSLEVYIDTYLIDPWYAYENVNTLGPEGTAVEAMCPQAPVGGYGAWEPGDPVKPRPGN
jgi:hypothetical protein